MSGTKKKLLAVVLTVAVVAPGSLLVNTQKAFAATVYPYYPNDLISESVFENSGAMGTGSTGVQNIQTFLNNENSGLKGLSFTESCSPTVPKQPYRFTYYPHCGKKESAATIIYDAGKAYGISPRAIMATMQKEESLITTPYSTSGTYQASVNCAMGYTDGYPKCSQSPFQGFFSQVDNGTWQLRTDVELMSGRNWWGYSPSSYPCAAADTTTHLYNNGLYPGRTVTFANPGGTSKTITIADAATAALYCYTPYVGPKYTTGPYQGTGYSGSFNFVESFEQWWGSTVYAYAGEITATTYYDDSARTQQDPLSSPFYSGRILYVTVSALNTGSKTWSQSFTHLATEDPNNRSSVFQDSSWLSYNRPAALQQSSVAPGQTGTFKFSIATPKMDGEYFEHFGLVADGQNSGWMKDNSTLGFDITVSNPYNGAITQLTTYRDSTYSQPTDPGVMTYGEKVYVRVKVKNTGSQTWSNSFTKLAAENPNNRTSVFHDSSWPETDRPAYMQESSVAPGQTGTFLFSMTAPGTNGTHSETFGLVADGQSNGWMPAPTFTLHIQVVDPPLDTLYSGIKLYPGQYLKSKNGSYTLSLQGDGNLVMYSNKGVIWASGTNGKSATYLVMQGDGNLVMYSNSGRPVWASGTAHRGASSLVMQGDGNLVIYDSGGHPTWASNTSHNVFNTPAILAPGSRLARGSELISPNGKYRLVLQGDGNLVLYSPLHAIWATGTDHTSAHSLVMQHDGNIVIYGNNGPLWASNTSSSGSTLALQDDGNLVLYSSSGHAIWATDTDGKV